MPQWPIKQTPLKDKRHRGIRSAARFSAEDPRLQGLLAPVPPSPPFTPPLWERATTPGETRQPVPHQDRKGWAKRQAPGSPSCQVIATRTSATFPGMKG